ncbi:MULTISPECIES: hypothetical protein [unclassified Vibrio]|uniref:hypothetical protein n=1 Tax=Vibrio TaxID=662 RepID=UPI0012694048|nr:MULTISPECIES: hypothetical protein [unclassified Vibrio]QFT40135.1 hypothetical protein FIU99_27465 [Vibrio sp. THAF64]QGM37958.1 hypothetical protein GGC04_27060 [Vibrio sp. THAF191d]QGN73461.1 hypothetical protein GGC03_27110 [Vibrio sp. THAF191c]
MMELAIVGLAIADRFLLKRNKVTIDYTRQIDDPLAIRFVLSFSSKRAIRTGMLTYSLRSKKRPSAVITRTRKLDFSTAGNNSEYLIFDKAALEKEAGEKLLGDWILDVKIERSCSFLNPLYKIFPTTTRHTEEFEIS